MSGLEPGAVYDGLDAALAPAEHAPVAGWQRVAGEPTTATVELCGAGGVDIGVWELTAGVMADVEVDEVFVVLSGEAIVEFEATDAEPMRLRPGSVGRLAAGMRTRWTVTGAPLRKIYIALGEPDE